MDDRSSTYLRPAERGDAWALARLRSASLLEQRLLPKEAARAFEREAFRELSSLFRDDKLAAWVLASDDRVAGSACVVFWRRLPYFEGSVHAELCGVYVEPALRRRGFARRLCARALTSARGRGARAIFVHSSAEGRCLYERLGFVAGGQMRLDFERARAVMPAAVGLRSPSPSSQSRRASSS